jgi:hypothetical protein
VERMSWRGLNKRKGVAGSKGKKIPRMPTIRHNVPRRMKSSLATISDPRVPKETRLMPS